LNAMVAAITTELIMASVFFMCGVFVGIRFNDN